MTNNFCLLEGLFKLQKNGIFLFEMCFFVLEILTFVCCADWGGDDVMLFAARGW